jgi:hypothetical protein
MARGPEPPSESGEEEADPGTEVHDGHPLSELEEVNLAFRWRKPPAEQIVEGPGSTPPILRQYMHRHGSPGGPGRSQNRIHSRSIGNFEGPGEPRLSPAPGVHDRRPTCCESEATFGIVADSGEPVDLPQRVYDSIDSVHVWGADPIPVNLLTWAIAQRSNREALWLVIRGDEPEPEEDPAAADWILRDRLYVARAEDFRPTPLVPTPAFLSVISSEEPQQSIELLIDFLSIPQELQQLLAQMPSAGLRPVLVVSHNEHFAGMVPEDPSVSNSLVRVVHSRGIKLVTSYAGPPKVTRLVFDHVLRVDTPGPGRWREGSVILERGTVVGPFQVGRPVPLARFVPFRTALERLDHGPRREPAPARPGFSER